MEYIVSDYALNMRRACRLVKQTRSVQYYRSAKDRRDDLRAKMRELANSRMRYGYRRIHVLLKRDGWCLGGTKRTGFTARNSCSFARSFRSGARWWSCGKSGYGRAL